MMYSSHTFTYFWASMNGLVSDLKVYSFESLINFPYEEIMASEAVDAIPTLRTLQSERYRIALPRKYVSEKRIEGFVPFCVEVHEH